MHVLELAGEDDAFAAAEAGAAAEAVEPLAPGLALARGLDLDRVHGLAYTRAASESLGRTDATVDAARALLEASPDDRTGSVAVSGRDVRGSARIDTRAAERSLGDVLVTRGHTVELEDPDHELRALFADGVCVLGWLAAESRRDFGDRTPTEKPFFQPGSMEPLDARAVCNLARAGPGMRLLDPLCGTGGVLVEGGLLGAMVVGVDAQPRMVRGARENLAHYLDDWAVVVGDAARLPLRGVFDAVIADVPYGRQSAVAGRSVDDLVAEMLSEARRMADRAVVVADRDRVTEARAAGWAVAAVYERPVHRSLTRFVHVLVGT